MKLKLIASCIIFFLTYNIGQTQQTIDGGFDFETVTNKKYSLYIPSGYDDSVPHQLMLGLHPLNTSRWDGQAWRDTLIDFAEMNNLILVSPDGGPDGRIDDAIDTSFTTALLDSVSVWYNINQEEKYIMGFSWGGKTTYTYGLRRTDEFAGYIVIGAAVNGLGEVADVIANAEDENFYLVHGSQDALSVRYTPLLNGLNDNNACTETMLMTGVGHTIDFPNRNQILSDAFTWVKNNNCGTSSTLGLSTLPLIIGPNPSDGIIKIQNIQDLDISTIRITNLEGKKLSFDIEEQLIKLKNGSKGMLIITAQNKNAQRFVSKIMIN